MGGISAGLRSRARLLPGLIDVPLNGLQILQRTPDQGGPGVRQPAQGPEHQIKLAAQASIRQVPVNLLEPPGCGTSEVPHGSPAKGEIRQVDSGDGLGDGPPGKTGSLDGVLQQVIFSHPLTLPLWLAGFKAGGTALCEVLLKMGENLL